MNIGDKILELRKSKGYSQEDIANKLNVSRQTVSKWETNQSMPEADKIVSLCNLFSISTDELLMNKIENKESKKEDIVNTDGEVSDLSYIDKKKHAMCLCLSIFLYFLSVMWIIFSESIGIEDNFGVVIFLGIIGVATVIIVYSSIMYSKSKEEKKKEKEKYENSTLKSINGIISLVFFVIYIILSFATMAWHITWILWILCAIVQDIVKLLFKLREGKYE